MRKLQVHEKVFLIVLFATALLSISAYLFAHHGQRTSSVQISDSDTKKGVHSQGLKSDRHTDPKTLASSRALLPPENAPLRDTFKDLMQLSNAGNAAASLRLFKDLKKCDSRLGSLSVLNGIYYHRPGQSDTEYAQQIQQKLEQEPALKSALDILGSTDKLCDGVNADSIESSGDDLRQAALQHDPEAMVCYATSYDLGPKYLSDAWFNYVARWQDEAPYMAQQALNEGEPGILGPLIDAYMPADPNTTKSYSLSQVVGPDPVLAYALSLVYARLAQGAELQQAQNNLNTLSQMLSPSQLAYAQGKADTLWPRFQQASDLDKKSLSPCPAFLSLPTDSVNIQAAQ